MRGSKLSVKVFDFIPLIPTFSRREKGLIDCSACTTWVMQESRAVDVFEKLAMVTGEIHETQEQLLVQRVMEIGLEIIEG